MNNLFYYLDGPNKKGPFSMEEIINLHLPETTWVYGDAMDKWKPISEVKELRMNPQHFAENPQKNKNQLTTDMAQSGQSNNNSASQKKMLRKLQIETTLLISKSVCSITFIALCLYNVIIASKFVCLLSNCFKKSHMRDYESFVVCGVTILLGCTIIAFAIFTKSILSNSIENN